MRISDWSSDVCSSDLLAEVWIGFDDATGKTENWRTLEAGEVYQVPPAYIEQFTLRTSIPQALKVTVGGRDVGSIGPRSEEHTSELQSLMRSSDAVFCLKKNKNAHTNTKHGRLHTITYKKENRKKQHTTR